MVFGGLFLVCFFLFKSSVGQRVILRVWEDCASTAAVSKVRCGKKIRCSRSNILAFKFPGSCVSCCFFLHQQCLTGNGWDKLLGVFMSL